MSRQRALVHGLGVAGLATARALRARGFDLVLADDAPNDERRAAAGALGVELVECPTDAVIDRIVRSVDLVAPAPGVPETHEVVRAAQRLDVALRTELDLAYEWEQMRVGGPRPMVAVTGTDGKTTTTLMVASLLEAAGHRVAAAGNTDLPLVDAIDLDVDVFAVECSSFRLSWLRSFRAEAAVWLNLAPDHLNWHTSMDSYEFAKANVWRLQRPHDVAVGWIDDAIVQRHLAGAPGRHVSFGLDAGDYRARVSGTRGADVLAELVGPDCPPGSSLASSSDLRRRLPHDLTNALAAIAACVESGLVSAGEVATGLQRFEFPPHRIEPVGEIDGAIWYNDSKATTPHAALTAIRAFPTVVLIAGGKNKGLDLSSLASEPARVRAVVAIGLASGEVADAFAGVCPVQMVPVHGKDGMADAVAAARSFARPGDAVLLAPACASFDWYPDGGYPARGDHFRALVQQLIELDAPTAVGEA